MVAGVLPFLLGESEVETEADAESACGCGDAWFNRGRLGLRADEGDAVAACAGLVLFLRFLALGAGVGVGGIGGIGGGGGADDDVEPVVGIDEDACWLAA